MDLDNQELAPLNFSGVPPAAPPTSAFSQQGSGAGNGSSEEPTQDLERPSRLRRILKWVGWTAFALVCLLVFTLMKLPDQKVKAYVDASISNALAPHGVTMTSKKSSISIGFGFWYRMEDVTLSLPPPAPPAHIDRIEVSPSLFSLVLGGVGGKIRIFEGKGKLISSFSNRKNDFSLSFDADALDLGKLGVLPALAGVQLGALLSGEGSIDGKIDEPSTLNGDVRVNLSKIVFEAQVIQGFSLPQLNISEGKLDMTLGHSKATVKTLNLGKAGSSDDLIGTVSGDAQLGKQWATSNLNLKTHFSLSPKVIKSLVLIDAILGPGKQSDGSYSYNLSGPINAPVPTPVKP